jgi:hypothetical protein
MVVVVVVLLQILGLAVLVVVEMGQARLLALYLAQQI